MVSGERKQCWRKQQSVAAFWQGLTKTNGPERVGTKLRLNRQENLEYTRRRNVNGRGEERSIQHDGKCAVMKHHRLSVIVFPWLNMCKEERERGDSELSRHLRNTLSSSSSSSSSSCSLSIFSPNQLFIPLHHHTMGDIHRSLRHTHTLSKRESAKHLCLWWIIYTENKAVLSFIKNTRQQLLKYSHTAETRGGRVREILKDLLRQKDKESPSPLAAASDHTNEMSSPTLLLHSV